MNDTYYMLCSYVVDYMLWTTPICCGCMLWTSFYILWITCCGGQTTCSPQHNTCCPQHVLHNIRYYICCGQHEHMLWTCDVENTVMLWRTFVKCCGLHVVNDNYMLWMYVVDIIYILWIICCGYMLWVTLTYVVENMLSTTCTPQHNTCYPQHVPTT